MTKMRIYNEDAIGWEHIVGVESDKENDYIDVAQKRLEHWLK